MTESCSLCPYYQDFVDGQQLTDYLNLIRQSALTNAKTATENKDRIAMAVFGDRVFVCDDILREVERCSQSQSE